MIFFSILIAVPSKDCFDDAGTDKGDNENIGFDSGRWGTKCSHNMEMCENLCEFLHERMPMDDIMHKSNDI